MHFITKGFQRTLIIATTHYSLGLVEFLIKVYNGNFDQVIGKKMP